MDAKFALAINSETGEVNGGEDIKNCTFVEAVAFLGTVIRRCMADVEAIAEEKGSKKEQAVALVLELIRAALEDYEKAIGKETMQKAYDLNSEINAERGK